MIATAEKIVDSGKAGLDTMTAVFNIAFDTSARLMALNLGTSRTLLQDGASRVTTMLDPQKAGELLTHDMGLGQSAIDNATACVRGAYEIVSEGQQAILQLMEPRIAEFNRELATSIDNAARSAPAGTDLALAAVMSALQLAKRATGASEPASEGPTESNEESSRRARKSA
ncbi:phasin family protein [Aromatoleum evansii]|uniref:Phasin family protein n=1 Tax=Aromatoleum evansii TaxID=59406 RepID=A0ABZ1AIC0_AROEV|nr:phasin family protein [Aromatoleum evansii]